MTTPNSSVEIISKFMDPLVNNVNEHHIAIIINININPIFKLSPKWNSSYTIVKDME
jgi:hypothetical protein